MKEKLAERLDNLGVKGKIILFLLALLIVMLPALWLHTRPVVNVFGHDMIRRADGVYHFEGNTVSIRKTEEGASFEGTVDGQDFQAVMTKEDRLVRTTFDDGTVIEGYDSGWTLLQNDDGSLLPQSSVVVYVNGKRVEPMTREEITIELWQLWQDTGRTKGVWWYVLVMSLVYLGGMATILWPEEMHFLFSRWRYQNAELSYDGIFVEKLGGWVLLIGSVVLMYWPVLI